MLKTKQISFEKSQQFFKRKVKDWWTTR